jgi:hypothetical protein
VFFKNFFVSIIMSIIVLNNFPSFSKALSGKDYLIESKDLLYSQISSLLPQQAYIITEECNENRKLIFTKDTDGDNKEEVLALYRLEKTANALFLIIIENKDNKWKVIDTVKADGFAFDILEFSDIDGDEKKEILLGTKIGEQSRNLNAYRLLENKADKLFSIPYSRFELIEKNTYGNKANNTVLALWNRDIDECFRIRIVRWNGIEFIEVKDKAVNKHYYTKLVDYYIEKIKDKPGLAYYWFYLAQAQGKCGLKTDALRSIAQGVSLDQSYPTKQQFEELKKHIIKGN